MQVNATIIAAQQAAREARAALLAPKQPQPAASFLSELNKEASAPAQVKSAPLPVQSDAPPAPMRMGSLLDIKI